MSKLFRAANSARVLRWGEELLGQINKTAWVSAPVFGAKHQWSLKPIQSLDVVGKECAIFVSVQGDKKNGFHLFSQPEGFFGADSHHDTYEDALEAGFEIFGVKRTDWVDGEN